MDAGLPFWALVKRELLVSLRGKGLVVCLGLLLAAFLFVVMGAWPDRPFMAGAAASATRDIFQFFCLVMMAAAGLLMPGLAASAITSEREANTYDQLHLTLIRPGVVVAAKLVNTLGVFVLFYVASLPVLATVMLLVGMDWLQIALAATVIFGTGVTCACLGLAGSTLFRHTVGATVAAYALMLVYAGLPLLIFILFLAVLDEILRLRVMTPWTGRMIENFAMHFTPPGVLIRATERVFSMWDFLPFTLFSLALSGSALAVAWRKLRRPMEEAARAPRGRKRKAQRVEEPAVVPDGANPVAYREARCTAPWLRRSWRRITIYLAGFGLFCNALLAHLATRGPGDHRDEAILMSLVTQMVCVLVLTPAFVANVLTKERELGNLDLLRGTLMSTGEVVAGKALGALRLLTPLLLAALVSGLPLALVVNHDPTLVLWVLLLSGYATLGMSVVMAVCLGLLAGAVARRTGTAVVYAYGVNVLVFGLGPLLLMILFFGLMEINDDFLPVLAFPSPPIVYVIMGDSIQTTHGEIRPPALAMMYWIVAMGAYALGSVWCVRKATRVFEARAERDG